jgi:hypothetical protein
MEDGGSTQIIPRSKEIFIDRSDLPPDLWEKSMKHDEKSIDHASLKWKTVKKMM